MGPPTVVKDIMPDFSMKKNRFGSISDDVLPISAQFKSAYGQEIQNKATVSTAEVTPSTTVKSNLTLNSELQKDQELQKNSQSGFMKQ